MGFEPTAAAVMQKDTSTFFMALPLKSGELNAISKVGERDAKLLREPMTPPPIPCVGDLTTRNGVGCRFVYPRR
jgi:hypothetical protein